jgi:beta-lactamase superfamily II metal-dependent hydrolase
MNRREFMRHSGGMALLGASSRLAYSAESGTGSALAAWRPGFLDLHHINTGRGNSTLILMPDGTSLLVDAGASGTRGPAMNPARPDDSKRPGQWIARYVSEQLKAASLARLDYALTTHLHGDHIGDVTPQSTASTYGNYQLTGLSDVAEVIQVGKLIDRGYPEYCFPAKVADPTGLNYIRFAESAARRGVAVEQIQVGSSSQIAPLRSPQPGFEVRVIAGNGRVWTGEGESSKLHFASQAGLTAGELASENSCSIALRLSYGKFSYFTGGDLTCDTNYGRDPWRDIETLAAKVSGPASVTTCNHHGYFDATGPDFVRELRPRVCIVQSWHASHPAMSVLARLYSPVLYPGPRDIFCLGLHPAAAVSCARFSDLFKSCQGHVVVRVAPGGAEFSLFVLDDEDRTSQVKAVFGPYMS